MSGYLDDAEAEARQIRPHLESAGPFWATKFRLQQARIAIYSGNSPGAIALLGSELPKEANTSAFAVTRDSLLSIASVRTGDLVRAEAAILRANHECGATALCGEVRLAEGVVAVEKGKLDDAAHAFELSLVNAQASGDKFLQTQALLNTAVVAERQDHYEDALDLYGQASSTAKNLGARLALEKAEGGAGSVLYKIGDFPHALANAQTAQGVAHDLGSILDEAEWLHDEGMSQYRMNDLQAARLSFERAYRLARSIQYGTQMGDALVALASLSLQQNDLPGALALTREAEKAAQQSGNSASILQPALMEATITARQGDLAGARRKLLSLLQGEGASAPRPFVRWQIEGELARVSEAGGDRAGAAKWFEHSIETFRLQRKSLNQIESRLPFIENGTGLYLDYMEELLRAGKTTQALAVLDRSRAETLTEGTSAAAQFASFEASLKNPAAVARRLQGTILVYCIRPGMSYLWAIAPAGSSFFRLPGSETIEPLMKRHTRAILAGQDVLAPGSAAGAALYQDLVAPAASLIRPGSKVFVIADGELSHLNFETLIASGQQPPHFWIEDADIVNAKSLSLLSNRSSAVPVETGHKRLLLVGDPAYTRGEDTKLPHAAEEVNDVADHFAPDQRAVLTGTQATPASYLTSRPGEYQYIHFVAHATASELNPLDSAVVLSPQPGEPETYKLYARDIMNSRIHADVVTISACFGSGVRAYSGEGLVGLAWAFLRAGSHNVVGALWEVSDVSTPQLMNDMYDGLAAGQSPDRALRAAKLAMIKQGGVFRKPFYWAAFQLYTGA